MKILTLKLLVVILGGLFVTSCSGLDEPIGEEPTATAETLPDDTNAENVSELNTEKSPQILEALETQEDKERPFSPTPSPLFEQNYGLNEMSDRDYNDLEILTLLPPDAIPAFTFPEYYSVKEANQEYLPEEMVIGVEFNGDARAYAVSLLSRHEIVNDTVGGIHLAVTW